MTDDQLFEGLAALADSDKLTDAESDLVVLAARVLASKKIKRDALVASLRAALHQATSL